MAYHASHFRVVGRACDDDPLALPGRVGDQPLDLGNKGAGAVQDPAALVLKGPDDLRPDPVRPDQDTGPRRHLVRVVRHFRPPAFQVLDDLLIVDDRPIEPEAFPLPGLQGLVGQIDRPLDPGTKTG